MSRSLSKKILKYTAYKTLSFEPLLNYWRRTELANKIIVLMYHEIAEDEDDIEAWTVVRKSDFIRQMEYLESHFSLLSLKDAISYINNSNSKDSDKPLAVITFDDGYAGNNRVLLPIIKSMKIPVTVFAATRHIKEQSPYWYDRLINALQPPPSPLNLNLNHRSLGNYCINQCKGAGNWREIERLLSDLKTLEPDKRENVVNEIIKDLKIQHKNKSHNVTPMSVKELQELAENSHVTIGAHSHCHNILTQLPMDDIRKSVVLSKQLLEAWINKPVHYFSYPNGNYNDDVINILTKTGFECSLTTVPRPWERVESLFTIPRIGIGRYDSFDYFKIKVSGSPVFMGLCR